MKVIVSVTTTRSRLQLLFYTIQSLMRQSYQDFEITVNLSAEPYLHDEGVKTVPAWLAAANVRVVMVRNSGPYRKLLPTINGAQPQDIVITADDDVIYAEEWLKRFIQATAEHPDKIVCAQAREIKTNAVGLVQNYANWPLITKPQSLTNAVPIGCAGVAYRRHLLDLEFLNNEVFLRIAPTADDLWFRVASLRKGTAVYADPAIQAGCAYLQHDLGLQEGNLFHYRNARSPIKRLAERITVQALNYLGKPLAKNDFAWRNTMDFSNQMRN